MDERKIRLSGGFMILFICLLVHQCMINERLDRIATALDRAYPEPRP